MSKVRLLLIALFALLLFACARDYVTGKRTFSLMSESQEVALGREADPQIVAEYGVYDDPELAAYIDSIGQAIARVSHRPNLEYTFRVVDSPIVNAFALPGGWVYFTRGILAHFNSEAELAGVMGHEVGHVVARHGAEQQSKATLAQLGLGVGSILSEEFRQISGLAQTGLSLLFLKFSRGQESESDRLGVEYSSKLGYNAHEMADFFRTIGALSGESGQSIPSFLSTHPNPADREVKVNQMADEWQTKLKTKPKKIDRLDYLRRIDGMVYGEDPRHGFVENSMFYHPELRFQFPVPTDWTVINSNSKVDIISSDQKAGIQFTLAKGSSPREAAESFIAASRATVERQQAKRINGLEAYDVISRMASGNNVLGVLSTFIEKDQNIYVFHGYASVESFTDYAGQFSSTANGFDQLRNQAALTKKPERVRIVRASRTASLKDQLEQNKMPADKLNELAILNGMNLDAQVNRGDYFKVVRE